MNFIDSNSPFACYFIPVSFLSCFCVHVKLCINKIGFGYYVLNMAVDPDSHGSAFKFPPGSRKEKLKKKEKMHGVKLIIFYRI